MPRQRGGALEPIQKVPPFHYTESEARKTWTRALYPYAPYFFAMFKEIPWKSFEYEDDDVVVKNSVVPYQVGGGSALEIIDAEYSKFLPVRLHKIVDPTGDIDVWVRPPILTNKHGKFNGRIFKRTNSSSKELKPWAEAYLDWLFKKVVRFFESLSYNFKAWYGDSLVDYDPARNSLADVTVQDLVRVGPFSIFKYIKRNDYGEQDIRIQVCTAIQTSTGELYDSHFIELLLFSNTDVKGTTSSNHDILIDSIEHQMVGNFDGIKNRIDLVDDTDYSHKIYNHFNRAIFLINLYSKLTKQNSEKTEEKEKVKEYDTSIRMIIEQIQETEKALRFSRGFASSWGSGMMVARNPYRETIQLKKLELLVPTLINMINHYPLKYRKMEFSEFRELVVDALDHLDLNADKNRNLESDSILTYTEYRNAHGGGSRRSTRRRRKSKA